MGFSARNTTPALLECAVDSQSIAMRQTNAMKPEFAILPLALVYIPHLQTESLVMMETCALWERPAKMDLAKGHL